MALLSVMRGKNKQMNETNSLLYLIHDQRYITHSMCRIFFDHKDKQYSRCSAHKVRERCELNQRNELLTAAVKK